MRDIIGTHPHAMLSSRWKCEAVISEKVTNKVSTIAYCRFIRLRRKVMSRPAAYKSVVEGYDSYDVTRIIYA
jgi:hypothetical protein